MAFFAVGFVVDIERCRDAWVLFACLNGADSYTKVSGSSVREHGTFGTKI